MKAWLIAARTKLSFGRGSGFVGLCAVVSFFQTGEYWTAFSYLFVIVSLYGERRAK